jgi:SAM-dependent methyltransferase
MDGHDRAMSAPVDDAAGAWAAALARWAIPDEILAQAPESPWSCIPADFAVDGAGTVETPSTPLEREVLPIGGTVLDVGCGGGRASLALAPPAFLITGIDENPAMLAQLTRTARARGVGTSTQLGRWPDVASAAPIADVVVCHHVVYNVADIVPFLTALTTHARLAVVLELTRCHPQVAWSDAWRHFWGIERPTGPTADDLIAIVRNLGWSPETWRHQRPADDNPFLDSDRAVRSTLRRLCLTAERAAEVAIYLEEHPLRWSDRVVTVRWSVAGDGPPCG